MTIGISSGKKDRLTMLTLVLAIVVVAVAAFLVYVGLQPSEFSISRSATMSTAPNRAFDQVNDFHNWETWSPWAKLDPQSKVSFDGPSSGEGAKFAWAGNKKVGEGRMTIVESHPDEKIRIRLEFLKPFAATNVADFAFVLVDGGTKVTWTMSGTNNFVGRIFCTLMNMDKKVGSDFEKGLASIKSIVES